MAGLPFNLEPAPRLLKHYSTPLDIADAGPEYEDYRGWKFVIDLDVPMSMNDLIAKAQDSNAPLNERNDAIEAWLKLIVVAWNFVDNETGEPLPQPREGGAMKLPTKLFQPLTTVAGQELQPKKA